MSTDITPEQGLTYACTSKGWKGEREVTYQPNDPHYPWVETGVAWPASQVTPLRPVTQRITDDEWERVRASDIRSNDEVRAEYRFGIPTPARYFRKHRPKPEPTKLADLVPGVVADKNGLPWRFECNGHAYRGAGAFVRSGDETEAELRPWTQTHTLTPVEGK